MRIKTLSNRNRVSLLSAAFFLMITIAAGALHAAVPTVTAPSPSPQTVLAGATVSFSVTASGTGPFTYFWQYSNGGTFTTLSNGGRIAGATGAALPITGAQTSGAGAHPCLVRQHGGQAHPRPRALTHHPPPPPAGAAAPHQNGALDSP